MKHKDSRNYAFLMIYYKMPDFIKEIQNTIDEEDLYTEEGSDDYGIEKECHVTLVPCLDNDVDLEELRKYLDDISKYEAILTDISKFENEKYDVLKCSAKSIPLFDTNKKITDNYETYSEYKNEYKPHMTIAYLKPGRAQKYVKDRFEKLMVAKPVNFCFSWHDKNDKMHKVMF